jgi:hypothetical protein
VDYSSLRALFRRIISVGPLLLLGGSLIAGCSAGEGCKLNNTTTGTFPVREGAYSGVASVDALLARCQASPTDCMPLCAAVAPSPEAISSCALTPSDGSAAVSVVYVWRSCG